MKPIKIVMSAFGSYGGVEEIDFEKINRGLFLITGDTGAGKTTVFDAITYALFDETSGGKRDGDMMRSQYAKEDIPTFVELTFSYAGARYTIKRNPNYRRLSKRKNKDGEYTYTTETAAVELILPDGKAFPGKNKETNEKIKEILGVDVNQFTQIAMIAQGEFLKLLHAPSKDRKEIFGRIFDTKIYGRIQNCLREQSKDLYISLSKNADFIRNELSGVICSSEEIREKWEQLPEQLETGKEEIIGLLAEMEEYFREEMKELQTLENDVAKELDVVNVQVAQAKEIRQQFDRKAETERSVTEITKELTLLGEELEKDLISGEELQRELDEKMPQLEQKLAEAKNLLPQYQVLQQRQLEVEEQKKALEQAKKKLEKIEHGEMETFARLEQIVICGEKELKLLQEQVTQALELFQKASATYEEYNRIFIEEQAGILAGGLMEGKPCPVCGSTSHPRKAELSGKAVSQNQVEEAKKKLGKTQENLEQTRESFIQKRELLEKVKQVRNNHGKRLFVDENQSIIPKGEIRACTIDVLKDTEQELEGLQNQKKQQQDAYYESNLSYEKAKELLAELQKTMKYPSKEILEKEISGLEKEKQNAENLQKDSNLRIQSRKEKIAKKEGILEQQRKNLELLTESLKDKEATDINCLLEQEKLLRDKKSCFEEKRMKIYADRDTNTRAKERLEHLYNQREQLVEKYQVVETLSRTANGNLRQQARLDLQTYVQRRYFKHMIGEANRRLIKMSNGRFILQCREMEQLAKQGEAGLDLDVYDMITDQVRDVKTLSGGESFLAALAMALGMADVIQNNAAKVRIETMFIDEGFGSLDEEARGKAIQILQELAGESRLVGIISHVTELKEQMDRKLIITKGEQGSHASWQLES